MRKTTVTGDLFLFLIVFIILFCLGYTMLAKVFELQGWGELNFWAYTLFRLCLGMIRGSGLKPKD